MTHGHVLKAMRHKHVMDAEIGPCSGGYETQALVVCVWFVCVCMCVCVCVCVCVVIHISARGCNIADEMKNGEIWQLVSTSVRAEHK